MAETKHIVIDARNRRGPGVGRYTDRLLEHLQSIGTEHRYSILVQPDDPWEPQKDNFSRVPASFPQFSLNLLNDFRFAYLLKSLRPDLVHFTMTQQPLFYRGNIITTTHDLTMLRFARSTGAPKPIFWLKLIGYRILFYVGHKKSKIIIVPSKYVAQALSNLYPFTAERIRVTYEASEPAIADTSVAPVGINKPFIFHVGSPFPHKNIEHLIQAFEILKEKNPDLQLVLVGKKEFYFEQLENWAKTRPYYSSIFFTGFLPDEQLKWLYENAEAYVWPSLSEGFGLPGLEAMAHGCPLVSSNATCLPEVYGEAAEYFDPTDLTGTVNSIQKVIGDPNVRDELINKGYEQIKKYSWRTMAIETLAAYRDALEK